MDRWKSFLIIIMHSWQILEDSLMVQQVHRL
jgi:hypothetical protein